MRRLLVSLVAALLVLPASAGAIPIATGEGQTCEVSPAGAALCWGARSFGSLGDGVMSGDTYDKVQVSGLTSGVTQIASSSRAAARPRACAPSSTAAPSAGAWATNGKLGDGTGAAYSLVPVDVAGLGSGVTDISTSAGRACAVHNGPPSAGAEAIWATGSTGTAMCPSRSKG